METRRKQSSIDKSAYVFYAWLVITKKQRELLGKKLKQKDSSGDFSVNTKLLRSIKPFGIAGNRKVIGGQNKLQSVQSIQLRLFFLVPGNLMTSYLPTVS